MHRLQSSIAGHYLVSVADSAGEAVPGSPFGITVRARKAFAAHSSLKMLHSTALTACQELKLQVAAADMYGNQVMLLQHHVMRPV